MPLAYDATGMCCCLCRCFGIRDTPQYKTINAQKRIYHPVLFKNSAGIEHLVKLFGTVTVSVIGQLFLGAFDCVKDFCGSGGGHLRQKIFPSLPSVPIKLQRWGFASGWVEFLRLHLYFPICPCTLCAPSTRPGQG